MSSTSTACWFPNAAFPYNLSTDSIYMIFYCRNLILTCTTYLHIYIHTTPLNTILHYLMLIHYPYTIWVYLYAVHAIYNLRIMDHHYFCTCIWSGIPIYPKCKYKHTHIYIYIHIYTYIYIYIFYIFALYIYIYMRVYSVHALCTGGGGITTTSVPVNEHGSLLYPLYIYIHTLSLPYLYSIYTLHIYIY